MLIEIHGEWQAPDRRYLSEVSIAEVDRPNIEEEVAAPALITS